MTVQDIFNTAMDLMDKRSQTGAIDATKTVRYKVRTPSILNIWQNENLNNGNLYKTYEMVCTAAEPLTWIKKEMPDDFKNIDQIIKLTTDGLDTSYSKVTNYKWEDKSTLYVNSLFEGTIRIVYKPIPTIIKSLTDTVQLDDVTATGAAYFLAAHLLLVEDPSTASFFNDRYTEYTANVNIKNPAPIEDIVDVQNDMGRW